MLRLVAVLVFLLSAAALALVNRVASRPRSQLFTAVDDPASDPARPPTAANPPQSSLNLPIIEPEQFEFFNSKLRMNRQLTRICRSLRSLKKERICEDPVVEAWYTADEQGILDDDDICPDVLFIRSHYDKLFQKIRRNRRVILTGNPGISKSV